MHQWLTMRNICYNQKIIKAELYPSIKLHHPKYRTQKINGILEEAGHSCLYLTLHQPDLNPTEKIWALIKETLVSCYIMQGDS